VTVTQSVPILVLTDCNITTQPVLLAVFLLNPANAKPFVLLCHDNIMQETQALSSLATMDSSGLSAVLMGCFCCHACSSSSKESKREGTELTYPGVAQKLPIPAHEGPISSQELANTQTIGTVCFHRGTSRRTAFNSPLEAQQ
jgi:hypothetical protein